MGAIKIYDLNKDFDAAREYAEAFLKANDTSDIVVDETMLVLEALLFVIFENDEDYVHSSTSSGYVRLEGARRLGETALKLSFDGKRYASKELEKNTKDATPEERILSAYAERIDYSFHTGLNRISIVTKRSVFKRARLNALAIILAIAAYAVISSFAGADAQEGIQDRIVLPIETLLGNAVLMVGAPVSFLSLLKNLTDTYILSERNHGLSRLRLSIASSSIISTLLALLSATGIVYIGQMLNENRGNTADVTVRMSIKEFILGLMPSDVFTPFQTVSPFPLIILAILMIYAFVSVGKYFDKLKDAIDASYALFSRMLGIVMFALPFFTFFAAMDVLLVSGFRAIRLMLVLVLLVGISLILPIAYYSLRIKLTGNKIMPFVRTLMPLIKENIKMTSAIDAAPFNVRYCAKNYGVDRGWLELAMPILAQINRDGNCFLVTQMAILVALTGNREISLLDLAVITILVFFLSYGSPNQPGSMLIGVTIILIYANSFDYLSLAILSEVIFGTALSIINIIGDIVTVVIDGNPEHSPSD